MIMSRMLNFVAAGALTLGLAGCGATVDKGSAKAQTGAPESAQVEVLSLPYNPNLPTYVVVVEPLVDGASGMTSGGGRTARAPEPSGSYFGSGLWGGDTEGSYSTANWYGPGNDAGHGASAQLVTALTRWGNISVAQPQSIISNGDGTYTTTLQEGEVGPFIIKGTVTEFNETAEKDESNRGGSLGALGRGVRNIGSWAGSRTTSAVGDQVAIANPSAEKKEMKRSGMVGMDLQIVDGRNGRIVQGFNVQGTFTTVSATSGMSLYGMGGGDAAYASSALGQATRAAMNDALQQTHDILSARVTTAE